MSFPQIMISISISPADTDASYSYCSNEEDANCLMSVSLQKDSVQTPEIGRIGIIPIRGHEF